MPDIAKILERTSHEVGLGRDGYERLLQRRDRRRRRERVAAAGVAFLITLVIVGAALTALLNKSQRLPSNETISPGAVGDLSVLWTGDLGGVAPAPAVTDGVIATATAQGHVTAFDETCRTDGGTCPALWTADVGDLPAFKDRATLGLIWWPGASGDPGDPAVFGTVAGADGVFYLVTRSGRLFAFAHDCRNDGGPCEPLWRGQVGRVPRNAPAANALPVVENGLVYATSPAGVWAFPVACGSSGSTCAPAWHSDVVDGIVWQSGHLYGYNQRDGLAYELDPATGKPIWWGGPGHGHCCGNGPQPVRYGDSVYENFGHDLYVFPATCRGACDPTWTARILFPFADGPVVVGDAVIFTTAIDGTHGGLLVFPVDCASGGAQCRDSHRTSVSAELTTMSPVVAQGRVYAVSRRGAGMYVFDASCLASRNGCQPVWTASLVGPDQPVITGGVVFVSDEDTSLQAFDEACNADPCLPLWQGGGTPAAGPVIDGSTVFATDTEAKTVVAYGIGGASNELASTGGGSSAWLVYVVAALIIAGGLVVARRRRSTAGLNP
jgi:LPXTG-motif cell wall-anchored protein